MAAERRKMTQNRYGVARPVRIRATLPVVTVVCDDTKTAVAYFLELKRQVKAKVTVRVEPAPCSGASASDILDLATSLAGALTPIEAGDSTWVLLDMEAEKYRRDQAEQAQRQAGKRVTVLLSDPCFEVWTLAHFVDTGEAFIDCAAVVRRIRTEWKKRFEASFGNKKGQADYAKLMPYLADAVRNAKKRSPSRDGSWTEVFRVVEVIMSLHNAAPAANAGG